MGHNARGCAMQGQSTNLLKTQAASNIHTPKHNVVTSFQQCVKLCIIIYHIRTYDSPVSPLVDTGAGVSLLNKEVWNKLTPAVELHEPATCHRLVGVDGIPLKVLQ